MEPMMRRFFLTAVIFVWVLVAAIPAALGDELRIGTWKTAQTIAPFFYEKFMDAGVKVTIFPFTNPADMKMALTAGTLEMCGTTIPHAIQAAARGEPLVVVASLCNKCSALVVGKHADIRTTSDLRGKKIGYVPGTMHEVLLRETLTRAGLNPSKEVTLTRVDFFDMGTALARGSIDAFLSGEPFPSIAVVEGYGRILSYPYYDDSIGAINAGMLVRRETIEKNPNLVLRLITAHARATEYLKKNPQEWLVKASEFGTPLKVLEQASSNMELEWKMDESYIKRAMALGERMKTLGLIDRQPNYEKLFDLSFVRRIQSTTQ